MVYAPSIVPIISDSYLYKNQYFCLRSEWRICTHCMIILITVRCKNYELKNIMKLCSFKLTNFGLNLNNTIKTKAILP